MGEERYHFERKSSNNTGKWVVIGDDSPVKSATTIQLVLKPKPPSTTALHTSSNDLTELNGNSLLIFIC